MLSLVYKSLIISLGSSASTVRCIRSIPGDRLKRLIEEQDGKMSNLIVPGRDQPSSWFLPKPRDSNKRVVGLTPVKPLGKLRICMVREGCTNRPFYTIQVKSSHAHGKDQGVEQLGSWDPFPNRDYGEQLIGLNVERVLFWMGQGAEPTTRVAELLGLAGILPVHPHSLLVAHRTRERVKLATVPPSVDTPAAEEEGGEEKEDPTKRPDAIWRKKNSRAHWWRHGLV